MWLVQPVTSDLMFHCANNPMMSLSAVCFHTASSFYISDVTAMGRSCESQSQQDSTRTCKVRAPGRASKASEAPPTATTATFPPSGRLTRYERLDLELDTRPDRDTGDK